MFGFPRLGLEVVSALGCCSHPRLALGTLLVGFSAGQALRHQGCCTQLSPPPAFGGNSGWLWDSAQLITASLVSQVLPKIPVFHVAGAALGVQSVGFILQMVPCSFQPCSGCSPL